MLLLLPSPHQLPRGRDTQSLLVLTYLSFLVAFSVLCPWLSSLTVIMTVSLLLKSLLSFCLFIIPVHVKCVDASVQKLLSTLFCPCICLYVLFLSVSLTFVCLRVCLRAQSYAERLRLGLAVMHGDAHHSESDMADGRQSPPLSRTTTGHTGLELPCKTHLCIFTSFSASLSFIRVSHTWIG